MMSVALDARISEVSGAYSLSGQVATILAVAFGIVDVIEGVCVQVEQGFVALEVYCLSRS